MDILVTPAVIDAAFDYTLRYPTADYGSLPDAAEDGAGGEGGDGGGGGGGDGGDNESGGGGGDHVLDNYLEWMLPACLISATGCPAIVLPAGKLDDGRPVGVQLVGKWGADAQVLEAAAMLEAALGQSQH